MIERSARMIGTQTAGTREHDCPLCGLRFQPGAGDCGPCPLKLSCGAVACPRCGYECYSPSGPLHALHVWGCEVRGWLRRLAPGT